MRNLFLTLPVLAALALSAPHAPVPATSNVVAAPPKCTAPLKPKWICVGSFCFWTCQR